MKFTSALGDELAKLALLAPGPAEERPAPPVAEPEKALPSFLQPASLPTPSLAPAVPLPPAAPPAPPSPPPLVPRPPPRLAGTMDADLSAIVAAVERGALPFSAPAGATATPPPTPPAAVARPPHRLSGTLEADASAFTPATPFAAATATDLDLAAYPLELYAALTGALARGEPREQVLAEHRLTPALFDELAHAWGAKLTADPQLLVRFTALARSSAAQGPRQGG